ncbi:MULTISPECIES: hypothetical protein [Actinosynnema]|uniref:hypothetical protein n=1 Tax=Actinosynnema TaxID=40566 RepID=UPI0020A4AB4C|nr:hypothetical protein [Actinosynnema pretiosum]MCP2099307.1 hypothetical protein [Actinosynnema pretiosum]
MRFAGRPSWRVALDTSGEVGFALHVRAALGLEQVLAPAVPPLDRPLPDADLLPTAELDLLRVTADWEDWWVDLFPREPARDRPGDGWRGFPAGLAAHEDRLRSASARWSRARRLDEEAAGLRCTRSALPAWQAVDELTAERGGEAPLFDLRIVELPVAGDLWRHAPRGFLLASTEALRADTAAARLKAVIRALLV